jgi:ribonucleoside-diphosphate reductase alpha chain
VHGQAGRNGVAVLAGGRVDCTRLRPAVRPAVRFLDDVTDVSCYPAPELAGPARAAARWALG